jgi:hypothetical protein
MLDKTQITILTLNKKDIKNFALERNELLKQVKTPWVFFLDSDEVLDKKYYPKINKIISKNALDGVFIKRVDYFYNKKLRFGEVGNCWTLRMAKTKKIKFIRPIHEVARVNGIVGKSKIIIRHNAHESVSKFLEKIIKYSKLEAEHKAQVSWSASQLVFQLLIYPVVKFKLNYFIKLGFFDGWRGLAYATIMSLHSLMVRVYLYEKTR